MTRVNYNDDMQVLRQLCKNYSEYMPGKTIFPASYAYHLTKLWVRHADGARSQLVEGRISQLCAIVDWEISKAEGRLRDAA